MDSHESSRPPERQSRPKAPATCGWLLCLLKIQRLVLALTATLEDHSKCLRILDRLGGQFGVFSCCHGVQYICCTDAVPESSSSDKNADTKSATSAACVAFQKCMSHVNDIDHHLEELERDAASDSNSVVVFCTEDQASEYKENVEEFAQGGMPFTKGSSPSQRLNPSLDSDVTFCCPICLEELPRKMAFADGDFKHTVCLGCTKRLLLQWKSSGDANIQCPTCRRNFPMKSYIDGFRHIISGLEGFSSASPSSSESENENSD